MTASLIAPVLVPIHFPCGPFPRSGPWRWTGPSTRLLPRLRPRGGLHPLRARGGPGVQRRAHARAGPPRVASCTRRWRSSRSSASRAYTNDDLFHQDALLDAHRAGARARGRGEPRSSSPVLLVGAPLRFEGKLFNCAVVIYRGRVLGIVPKTLPAELPRVLREAAVHLRARRRGARGALPGRAGPVRQRPGLRRGERRRASRLHVEICEDVWTPIPPSTYAALAGATVLANLSASNITIGKAEYRRDLCAVAVGQVHRRLPLLRRRPGRVDHRPGLGRPRADLRERRAAGRVASASPTRSRSSPPTSTWSGWRRTGCG